MKSEAKSWFSNCHIDNLLSNKYITSFMHFDNNTEFTVNVRITHIWKKDACVLWCTHIKTFVWHHGCLFCCFSVANGWRNRNRAEQRNRSWTKNAAQQMEKTKKKKVRNTLAYRFSGLSLELSCLATLCTVSGNQKNMLQDTW